MPRDRLYVESSRIKLSARHGFRAWCVCYIRPQKPVECMRRPMLNNAAPGQPVYDPFLGSGTSVIAAETTGRLCYGLELDPAYVDVIVTRWQAFTGAEATLEGDGRVFGRIAAERARAGAEGAA